MSRFFFKRQQLDLEEALRDTVHYHPTLEHGEEVQHQHLERLGINSMEELVAYSKMPIGDDLVAHVGRRDLNVLMVCEKNILAEEIVKKFSNHVYETFIDTFPGNICATSFTFAQELFGRSANCRMISTNGHINSQTFPSAVHGGKNLETLYARVIDQVADGKHIFPDYLEKLANGGKWDLVILFLDNDDEGEYIGFEIMDLLIQEKHVNVPRGGKAINYFLRAKFSSATEAVTSLATLGRPDLRRVLAMVCKHHLDLRCGVALSRCQKFIIRGSLKHYSIPVFSYRTCGSLAVALVTQYYLKKTFSVQKFCVEISINIQGEILIIHFGEFEEWKAHQMATRFRKCQCLVNGPTHESSIKVKSPAGLNTFELMKYLSKHRGIKTADTASAAQYLYQSGMITYPRSENSKFNENNLQVNPEQLRQNLQKMGDENILFDAEMEINLRNALGKGIDSKDHPPIMPTSKEFDGWRKRDDNKIAIETKVYSFICHYNIAVCMEDYVYRRITAIFKFGQIEVPYSYFKEEFAGFTELLPELKIDAIDESTSQFLASKLLPFSRFPFQVQVKEVPSPELLKEYQLVQYMEDNHIGTDGSIPKHIEALKDCKYIIMDNSTFEFTPTILGETMSRCYEHCMPEFIKPKFRADFIRNVQKIATGEMDFVEVYNKGNKNLEANFHNLQRCFYDYIRRNPEEFKRCFQLRCDDRKEFDKLRIKY